MEFCEEAQRSTESGAVLWLLPWGRDRAREIPYSPIISHKMGKRMEYTDCFSAFAHASGSKKNIVVDQEKGLSPLITLHFTTSTSCSQFCIPQYRKDNNGDDGENSAEVIDTYSWMWVGWIAFLVLFSLLWLQREPKYLKLGYMDHLWGELLKAVGGSRLKGLKAWVSWVFSSCSSNWLGLSFKLIPVCVCFARPFSLVSTCANVNL